MNFVGKIRCFSLCLLGFTLILFIFLTLSLGVVWDAPIGICGSLLFGDPVGVAVADLEAPR